MNIFKSLLLSCAAACWVCAAPLVIAHRGGAGERPENTLPAIRAALDHGAHMIWLSIQVSRDGVPVLYRPADLSALTQGSGPVAGRTLAELRELNAGWQYRDAGGQYPYRERPVPIATLAEALDAIPAGRPVLLDLKSEAAEPLVQAVTGVLDARNAWRRVRLYSTQAAHLRKIKALRPQAQVFEERDTTRSRLVSVRLGGDPGEPPTEGAWVGFELRRKLEVKETFTLGEGRSETMALLWDSAVIRHLRSRPGVVVVLFGVETERDLALAETLGVDAVMTDSPRALGALQAARASRAGAGQGKAQARARNFFRLRGH